LRFFSVLESPFFADISPPLRAFFSSQSRVRVWRRRRRRGATPDRAEQRRRARRVY
jgi:hypothetical protein